MPTASLPKKLGYVASLASGAVGYVSGVANKAWEVHTIRSDGKVSVNIEVDIDEDGTYELDTPFGAITDANGGEMHAYKIEMDEYARFKFTNNDADNINIAIYGIEYS